MARKMVLFDGTELTVNSCGTADEDQLSFAVQDDGRTLPELVALLARPEATAHIEVRGSELVDVYDGYTVLAMATTLIYPGSTYFILLKEAG